MGLKVKEVTRVWELNRTSNPICSLVKKKANKNEICHLTDFIKVSLNKGLFKVAAVTKPVSDCTEPAEPAAPVGWFGIPGEARWFSSVVLQTKYHKRDQDV